MMSVDEWDMSQLMFHSYIYNEGNNFAITVTVREGY
jgi:hypothetical protein